MQHHAAACDADARCLLLPSHQSTLLQHACMHAAVVMHGSERHNAVGIKSTYICASSLTYIGINIDFAFAPSKMLQDNNTPR